MTNPPATPHNTERVTIQAVDTPTKNGSPSSGPSKNVRVSFREDVLMKDHKVDPLSTGSLNTVGSSSTMGDSSSNHYSNLRSRLTREQKNRDPFFFYQVTKNLGSGSMGDVKLVKKRANRVGGSARRDIQQAVKWQQRNKDCLKIPVVGGLFRFCMDAELNEKALSDASSHHSVFSILSAKEDPSDSRSFEDSLAISSANAESEIIYAFKSLHLDLVYSKALINELRNEIALLKDLDHPNIVRAIETYEWRGKISIVMELCSGGDLYSRDPYSEADAARIISYILSAIAYMHSRKVVHRDLKFENCLFVNTSPMSEVKLIDFGLSTVYVDKGLTDKVGTIYTMAPEVIMGNHTEKADMWSIGVMAVMLLSSSLPFYGYDRAEVIKQIFKNKYAFKTKRWKYNSPESVAFVKTLLVTDPAQRADAETALGNPWLATSGPTSAIKRAPRAEEEEMARSSMLNYSKYSKLKKMALMVVAHKSSSEEIGVLRRLFQKYDSRHDGSIWFEEFREAWSGSGKETEELRSIFDAMDLGGDGRIRYTEFIAATIEAHGTISEARLAEAFDLLDCDDSGYITAANLIEILGNDVPVNEIDTIIKEAEVANDKGISYSAFLSLWEDKQIETLEVDESTKVLGSELSSLTTEATSGSEEDASQAVFLREKHLQNTLHTWNVEMQLPAQVFAHGCSFLHQAAMGNQFDLEKMVEQRPGLVNFRDYDRRTALHIAASEGNAAICQFLIRKGARVNRSDRWGGFPLDDAHRHERSTVIDLLRQHGAKFGSTSRTVNLITAASEGNVEEVKTLLEFGSMDFNQGDYDHRTALHLAANEGHLEVVKVLCEAGADVNVKDRWGDRPLDDAKKAKKNSTAIINILSGAVTIPAADEPAADEQSADRQAPKMTDLKDRAAQPTAIPIDRKDEGMTQLPIQEFAKGCSILHQSALGNQIVLKGMLLESPELANFRDYDRRTPLHLAASEGQLEVCQFLVEKGARISRVDRWGGSPLDDAHRERHVEVVQFLREQGAKFGSTSQATNFITAASEGDMDEVQAFLDFGSIDLNQGDYDLRTAMHLAVNEGQLEIVRMLCDAGADVNVEDRWGHRPLDEASHAKKNSISIVKLLRKHGATTTKFATKISTAILSVFGSG